MAANLVAPSDVTTKENKFKIAERSLGFFECIGLLGISPMLHIHYSKMSQKSMRAVVNQHYPAEVISNDLDICLKHQESVHKFVVSNNYMWGMAFTMTGFTWCSLRRYNYQSRLIALPFVFYGGTFVGRMVGDIMTDRKTESDHDGFLDQVPAKKYYDPEAAAAAPKKTPNSVSVFVKPHVINDKSHKLASSRLLSLLVLGL